MGLGFYKRKLKEKAKILNHPRPYPDYLLPMTGEGTRILDVGSGPFSLVGTQGANVNLVACDVNADEYYQMMKEQGIVPIVPIEKQDMEHLTYPDDSFDIVHCVNALDHTPDAIQALKEIMRVSSKWIYLRHFENEAEKHHYRGGHYWNLDRLGRLWNQSTSYNMKWWNTSLQTSYKNKQIVVSIYEI